MSRPADFLVLVPGAPYGQRMQQATRDMGSVERRQTTRLRREIVAFERSGERLVPRRVLDFGQEGVRLAAHPDQPPGTRIDLYLHLGDRPEPLGVCAEIVAVRGEEAGAKLVGIDTRGRVRLLEVVFGDA